jgi:hypothetical protein
VGETYGEPVRFIRTHVASGFTFANATGSGFVPSLRESDVTRT